MKLIKYIFFDMGYTLVNEDNAWIERCKEQAGFQQTQSKGVTANILMDDIKKASSLFKPQWKTIIEKYGFTQSAKYKSEFETLYDDTCFVLDKLSKKFKLGIIANQSGDLTKRLRSWKIDKYFKVVVSSSDYGFSKPDERLFKIALNKSDCAARNAVMIGDRLDNDILPANKLGFCTVRIRQGFAKGQIPPSTEYQPTFGVDNLTEILSLPFMQQ